MFQVAVEIKEVTNYFNGPLRVGFISIDPASFQHNVPTGRGNLLSLHNYFKEIIQDI